MKYLITVRDEHDNPSTYPAIGDLDAIIDAAIERGARGISYRVLP